VNGFSKTTLELKGKERERERYKYNRSPHVRKRKINKKEITSQN